MLNFKDYISNWPDVPYSNFAQWLEGSVSKWGNNTAILFRSGGNKEFTRWTYAKLGQECRRIAQGLLASGLTKGDRVALWAENRPEWMIVWLGAAISGLVIVPIDFLASEKECLNILSITGAKAFFHSARKQDFSDSLAGQGISIPIRISLTGEKFPTFGVSATTLLLKADISENDPVSISRLRIFENEGFALLEISVRKRRIGFMDVNMQLPVWLDSPDTL